MCPIVIYHIHINFIFDGIQCILIKVYTFLILPSSGQTLALAEPEARLYNHHPTHPTRRSKCLYWLYLRHFSTERAEILHDCYLGGKDEVCRQNIDPSALQYSMQRCSISIRIINQPFLIGLS